MSCKKVLAQLEAYVDGELSQEQGSILESHLTSCQFCRSRLDEIQRIDELFQNTLPVPPAPSDLTAKIVAAAQQNRRMEKEEKSSMLPLGNLFGWLTDLSAPMKLAICCTVLLAFVTVSILDIGKAPDQNRIVKESNNLYGLEWFAPAPPKSIGSIYIAMADQPQERGEER